MPGPIDFLRLTALAVFLALVAVGLWLLDVAWWVIPPVMVVALFVAWTIEWLAWRQGRPLPLEAAGEDVDAVAPAPSYEAPPPAPAQAIQAPSPSQPEAVAPPAPQTEPEPAPEPAAEPESETVPAQESPPEPVTAPPPEPEEPARPTRRQRRVRLRSVPSPPPQPEPEPATPAAGEAPVLALRPRTFEPRQWNLWDLERIAREQRPNHPERRDEWSYLFLHLRQFADADGSLPTEFDGLVRESFGGLLEPAQRP